MAASTPLSEFSPQLLQRLARLGNGAMRVQVCLDDATPARPGTAVSPWLFTLADAQAHAAAARAKFGAGRCVLHYRESL